MLADLFLLSLVLLVAVLVTMDVRRTSSEFPASKTSSIEPSVKVPTRASRNRRVRRQPLSRRVRPGRAPA